MNADAIRMQGEQTRQQGQQTHEAVQQLIAIVLEGMERVGGPPTLEATRHDSAFDEERERYLARVIERYRRIDLEILTPLSEQGAHPQMLLGTVFVPQLVRSDPPPVELPREIWRRLAEDGRISTGDLPAGLDCEALEKARAAYQQRPARAGSRAACEEDGEGVGQAQSVARRGGRGNAEPMRLFHRSPSPRPALQRWVSRPWDPPQTEFPGIVPINTLLLGRSEQAAIAITGISVYSNGFEFVVTALIHPGAAGFDAEPPDGRMLTHRPYQIGLQLADGRTVTSDRPHGDAEPTGPILQPRGGGGTSHYQHRRLWAWPLPPSGPLEFICRWPTLGSGETRVGIDAQLILDTARQCIQLWPDRDG